MTLQPYDGANRVRLPDGRECWEKETEHFFSSETITSYQYSVEIGDLSTDYYGRVIDLKVRAPDGSWAEPVAFLPASPDLMRRIKSLMEQGWELFAEQEASAGCQQKVLDSRGYLSICGDVLALLKSMEQKK